MKYIDIVIDRYTTVSPDSVEAGNATSTRNIVGYRYGDRPSNGDHPDNGSGWCAADKLHNFLIAENIKYHFMWVNPYFVIRVYHEDRDILDEKAMLVKLKFGFSVTQRR